MRQPTADVPRITGLSSQAEVARHHDPEPELIAIQEDSAIRGRERLIQGGANGTSVTSIFIWQVVPTPACLKIRQNRLQNAGCSGQSTCQMKMDVTLGPVPHRRAGADGRTPDHGVRSRQSTGPPASQGLLGERSAGRTLAGKSSIPLEYLSRRNPSPSVLSPRVPNSRASPRRLALHSRDRHGEALEARGGNGIALDG